MQITVSIDDVVADRATAYAQAHDTTIEQLFHDYLRCLAAQLDPEQAAAEFLRLARTQAGRSEEGYVFDRDAIHERGGRE